MADTQSQRQTMLNGNIPYPRKQFNILDSNFISQGMCCAVCHYDSILGFVINLFSSKIHRVLGEYPQQSGLLLFSPPPLGHIQHLPRDTRHGTPSTSGICSVNRILNLLPHLLRNSWKGTFEPY